MSSLSYDAHGELPPIDEHIAPPETRYEIDDGELVYVPPAQEPHGERHSKLAALLEAHAADDFNVAVDMLTRISWTKDRAPDASVYPRARDPRTGGRQIEQLAFEVVSTRALGRAGVKAAELMGRGVRRVFAIDVERACVCEWSSERAAWTVLDDAASIVDPALAAALPVAALAHATKADDAIAQALLSKHNPVLEAAIQGGRCEGMARAILTVLAARALAVQPGERDRILAERDPERLARWTAHAASCASAAELFAIR